MAGEFRYGSGVLRTGGAQASDAAEGTEAIRGRWAGRSVDGLLFGDVPGAPELGTDLTAAATELTRCAEQVDTAHRRGTDRRRHSRPASGAGTAVGR